MNTIHLVDPAVRSFVSSTGLFDPERDPLDVFRKQLLASYAQIAPAMPDAREERRLPGAGEVRVLVYRPQDGPPPSCAIVYVHGGGFIAGAAEMTDAMCVQLANEHRALVVSVDYRLAPESPFPGPVEECYAALSWVTKEAPSHEYHAGAAEWCEHLGKLGIRVLRNEYVALERSGSVLHLAGIDDHESASFDIGHRPDLPKAVAGRDRSCPLVLLAHQPRAIHEAVRNAVDLQLSGHTHGGQLWPLTWLMRAGQPVVAGLVKFGETFVYVSRGTGHSGPPMRLAAPAEITDIILRSA